MGRMSLASPRRFLRSFPAMSGFLPSRQNRGDRLPDGLLGPQPKELPRLRAGAVTALHPVGTSYCGGIGVRPRRCPHSTIVSRFCQISGLPGQKGRSVPELRLLIRPPSPSSGPTIRCGIPGAGPMTRLARLAPAAGSAAARRRQCRNGVLSELGWVAPCGARGSIHFLPAAHRCRAYQRDLPHLLHGHWWDAEALSSSFTSLAQVEIEPKARCTTSGRAE